MLGVHVQEQDPRVPGHVPGPLALLTCSKSLHMKGKPLGTWIKHAYVPRQEPHNQHTLSSPFPPKKRKKTNGECPERVTVANKQEQTTFRHQMSGGS